MSNTPRAVRKAGAVPVANPLAADIRPGQSIELLKELHILTREGKLNQDSRRKLKQVYHLFQFIEKLLLELPDGGAHATLADHGAGKSYLGFIIYDLFFMPIAARVGRVKARLATSTASKPAPSWSTNPAPWRRSWVLTTCLS